MNLFAKPHILGFARNLHKPKSVRARRCFHPYAKKLFETHDVFPLLILDGGAFFFSQQHLGGGTAADFVRALEAGSLFAPWLDRKKVLWDRAYDDTAGSACRPAMEKHVWLNRLYFLLTVAQQFLRTKDEKWPRLWFEFFADWMKAHPYPKLKAGSLDDPPNMILEDHAKGVWHDMQVAWRLLVLVHSVYMLEKSRSLKKAHWEAIYEAIRLHARHVYGEAARDLATGKGRGNHFLQKGAALLYAGVLFPEFPEAERFIETGRAVVENQMSREIRSDGGSVEASPSYSHFIARLYLDACLLLARNKLPPISGLKPCVQKQYRFLDETASPAGRTLQLSDSYALDADADLSLVSGLLPFTRSNRSRSICFKESCFAVLRSRRAAVYLDGMALGMGHHHAGKPNLLVFVDGKPLVVDLGCANYDLKIFPDWFKIAPAHNVVLVSTDREELGLPRWQQTPVIRVAGFEQRRDYSAVMMVYESSSEQLRYEWTRTVLLRQKTIEVIDRVAAPAPVHARQVFHLAPINTAMPDGAHQVAIQWDGADIVLRQVGGQTHFERAYRPAVGPDNEITYAPELSLRAHGTDVQFHVSFELP